MDGTVIFLILCCLIGSALIAVSYFIGMFVEATMGPGVSMFVFLGLFMTSQVIGFPVAAKLTPPHRDPA
jgi:hypothetical protein